MKLLAVDTALGACSAALLDGDRLLAHRFVAMERGHAEALAPMVESVMREVQLVFHELDRLAVTIGPGTFTGQRVGLAFMRGLRLALKIPLIGVTTLDAMAAAATDETGAAYAAVLHDAKRSEVYVGLTSQRQSIIEPRLLPFEDALTTIEGTMVGRNGRLAFAGTAGSAAYGRYRRTGAEAALSSVLCPDAQWIARLAIPAIEQSNAPRPLYLRPPDARLPAGSTT